MRKVLLILFLELIASSALYSQKEPDPEGTISHITSSSVYVRFSSTSHISKGDTLYSLNDKGQKQPALIVRDLSSLSCVCEPINSELSFKVNDKIWKSPTATSSSGTDKDATKKETSKERSGANQDDTGKDSRTQLIKGRIAVASYNNFSNTESGNNQRMRYTFALNADNISQSNVSAETYLSFVHRSGQWDQIKENIFHGLKIYNLNVGYRAGNNLRLTLGRKINHRLSNMGAVDGLQVEFRHRDFYFGAIVGSRPDILDYSFNTSLFQYGAYISHDRTVNKGNMQTTLAFADQRNKGSIDRRFTYIQHSNSAIENLHLFGSLEFDLYRLVNEQSESSPRLSNLYFSARYRPLRTLSLALSYSARKNIIYYETYKTALENLVEQEFQQGYMAQVSYRPVNKLSIGGSAGYRNRKNDPKDSRNAYLYATYSDLPVIRTNITISANLLETSYLSGNIYSVGLSRNIFKQRMSTSVMYRYQDYNFEYSESSLIQNTIEAGINWHIRRKLNFAVNYEGTFEEVNKYNRIYIQLSQRF